MSTAMEVRDQLRAHRDHVAPGWREVPLRALLEVFQDGDMHGWDVEFAYLWEREPAYMEKLTQRIQAEGIREPILLGTDGRVWDGHHRIAVAHRLHYATVPVEFAGRRGQQPTRGRW